MILTTKFITLLARYKNTTGKTSLHTNERMNPPTKFINLLAKRMNITGMIVNRMPKPMNATGVIMNQTPRVLEFLGHNPQTRNSTSKHHQNLSITQDSKEKEHLLGRRVRSDDCGDEHTEDGTTVSATLGKHTVLTTEKI